MSLQQLNLDPIGPYRMNPETPASQLPIHKAFFGRIKQGHSL